MIPVEYKNSQVMVLSLQVGGSDGIGDGQFSKSEGLDVDPDGYVYVADIGNKRIQVFALSNSTAPPTK